MKNQFVATCADIELPRSLLMIVPVIFCVSAIHCQFFTQPFADENHSTRFPFLAISVGAILSVSAVEVLITEDTPSRINPTGLKGAVEGGINAMGTALA